MWPGLRTHIPSPVTKNVCRHLKISMAKRSKDFIIIFPNLTVTHNIDSLNSASGQSMSKTVSNSLPKIQMIHPCTELSSVVTFTPDNDLRTPDLEEHYSQILSNSETSQLRINGKKDKVSQKMVGSVTNGLITTTTTRCHR